MNKAIAIIIPSYKEVDTLKILLRKIITILPDSKLIIVDDSPEEENKKIQKIIKDTSHAILISRGKKLGRGSAVLQGFSEGLRDNKIDYFFEMDSDLAHDPNEITKFLAKMEETNSALVIGSRYLPGGIVTNMPLHRKFLSKIINTFLYFWLGVKLTDYTSGFRLYNRAAVEYLEKANLQTTGFITLSEIIYKLHQHKFRIAEVPISVSGRATGKSTVTLTLLLDSLFSIIKIRLLSSK